jgi:hypothetical protein
MSWLRWALAPVPLCVAFALLVMTLSLVSNRNCFELGTDGAGWRTYIDYQVRDRAPYSQLGVDAHQGDFDSYYPLDNDYTLPGAAYRLLGKSGPPGAIPTYAVYTVVLALTVFLLCKFIGVDAATACFAAFIAMFFFPPLIVHHPAPTFRFLHLNPHWMQLIIFSVLAICSLWALDGKWTLGRVLLMCVPAACATVEIMSVGAMIIFTPAVALYGGASLLFSQNRQAAVQKLGAAAIALLVVVASGQATYLYSLERYSDYHYFKQEFDWDYPALLNLSIGFAYPLGTMLIGGGLAGAIVAAFGNARRLRQFAFVHLGATALFFAACVAFYYGTLHDGYRTSSPFYFETTYMPFAAMFCAFLIARLLKLLAGNSGKWGGQIGAWLRIHATTVFLGVSIAAVAAYNLSQIALGTPDLCDGAQVYRKILPSEITTILSDTVGLHPGAPFRGNVVTIDPPDDSKPFSSDEMAQRNQIRFRQTGNEHRFIGLWRFGIPTMYQYFTFITAPYYVVLTDFLARQQDVQTRSGLVLTQIDPKMLRLWGVRFLITDDTGDVGRQTASLPIAGGRPVRLIELDAPNLGNYSPTSVRVVPDFRSGLELMHAPTFDGTMQVVTDRPLEGDLVKATNVRLVYETYGFHIEAESTGDSILVLPPQFSRCWSAEGAGTPLLFRANLMQLGLRFSGKLDARLIFRYGPLFASGCRLADIADIERMNISQARAAPRAVVP